ncbi:MAG TPA: hypothetical protein VIN59_02010 [Alphaproteobacteria bacterium]
MSALNRLKQLEESFTKKSDQHRGNLSSGVYRRAARDAQRISASIRDRMQNGTQKVRPFWQPS